MWIICKKYAIWHTDFCYKWILVEQLCVLQAWNSDSIVYIARYHAGHVRPSRQSGQLVHILRTRQRPLPNSHANRTLHCDSNNKSQPRFNIKKANREAFTNLMRSNTAVVDQDWNSISVPEKVSQIHNCISQAAELTYPRTKTRKWPPTPWFNNDILEARKSKRRARRNWKKKSTTTNHIEYKRCIAIVKRRSKTQGPRRGKTLSAPSTETPLLRSFGTKKTINGRAKSENIVLKQDDEIIVDKQKPSVNTTPKNAQRMTPSSTHKISVNKKPSSTNI